METITTPILFWVVAGKNGMELWGYDNERTDEWTPTTEPDCKVKITPLHWDFSFPSHDGVGRVRIGAGCQYNPMQMIEAMYVHLAEMGENSTTGTIHIELPDGEVEWSPAEWSANFSSDWE